jgi:hypothetical protein
MTFTIHDPLEMRNIQIFIAAASFTVIHAAVMVSAHI